MAEENVIIIDDDTDDDYDYWMDIGIEPLEDSDYDSNNSDNIVDELL